MNEFQKQWKQRAEKKLITSIDMALLALVRASKKDKPFEQASFYLLKSFKPITNQKKINNGAYPYFALWMAVRYFDRSPLLSLLDEETISKIKVLAANIAPRYMEVKLYGTE